MKFTSSMIILLLSEKQWPASGVGRNSWANKTCSISNPKIDPNGIGCCQKRCSSAAFYWQKKYSYGPKSLD